MRQDDPAILSRLQHHGVEFVIIGGVCGVLHGVSLVTLDLDVCCRFSPTNLKRLEAALRNLHPFHRLTPNKLPLQITDELAAQLKNLYLQTDLGTLDCLSQVTGIGDYEQVWRRSVTLNRAGGVFPTLDLDGLIAAKEALGRERDLAALKQLRAIKEKTQRRPS